MTSAQGEPAPETTFQHQRQRMPRRHAIERVADVGVAHAAAGYFHYHLVWCRIQRG